MGSPRKKDGESGLFVALLRGDAELLSLWMRGGGAKEMVDCVARRACWRGGGSGVGFHGRLPACLRQGGGFGPGLSKALEGGGTGLGFGFGFCFGFGFGCIADGSGSGGR